MNTFVDQVKAYHQRTKHQPQRYAAGPDTLDWDAQPKPFRDWIGAPVLRLPLVADQLETTWGQLCQLSEPGACPPKPLTIEAIACLLELSFALTAWKQYGPDRWALRANPSSGNLHPTEVYVLVQGVQGLRDGLYHYAPREHALVLRAACADRPDADRRAAPQLWIGLSSIQWREAWKYGERAFRYCQLDAGHALGALRYAAAAVGWHARATDGLGHADLAHLMGLDRDADFGLAEREEPEMLVRVGPGILGALCEPTPRYEAWFGQASRLDTHPMYRWPVIDDVVQATRRVALPDRTSATPDKSGPAPAQGHVPAPACRADEPAATIIRGRRSAQHFDRRATMPLDVFVRIMRALMPDAVTPWDAWAEPVRVHPIVFAHRIEGLAPGAYVLPRTPGGEAMLRAQLKAISDWRPLEGLQDGLPDGLLQGLPLWRLAEHPGLAGTLRTLSCHQAIGSDACFAVSLVAAFAEPIAQDPSNYRSMLQEAGLIGQVLYLQAEAEWFRGTGIGCYFDDAVHDLLGIDTPAMQVLYHFTVGVPMADQRITTEPPYSHLQAHLQTPLQASLAATEGTSP